jgi:hypothetical protein
VLPKAALVPPNTAPKLPKAALVPPNTAPAGECDDDDDDDEDDDEEEETEAAGSNCTGGVLGAVLGTGAVLATDPSAAAPGTAPSMCACKNGRASTLGKLGRCEGSFISSDVTR